MNIVQNDHVLNCFKEVIDKQTEHHGYNQIAENLKSIINNLNILNFVSLEKTRKFLGLTMFNGEIFLKKEWLNQNLEDVEDIESETEDIESLGYYKINITFIILTAIHEFIHIYRRKYVISENPFDITPEFNVGETTYNDAGDAIDSLIFGKHLERVYDSQAKLILDINTWKNFQTRDEFLNKFRELEKDKFTTYLPFKSSNGVDFGGMCYFAALREHKK